MGGSLGVGAVFSRASSGWYTDASGTLASAAINTPRFDYDPVTLQLKGVLLEDASTNVWLNSSNAATWTGGGTLAITATANQTTAPDGTVTAARAAYPAVSVAATSADFYTAIVGTTNPYTFSVWMRGTVGGEQLYLMATVDGANFYKTLATLTTTWQRFTLTTPALTTGTWYFQLGVDLHDATQTAKPAQNIFVWGAQVELNFMSSYIPTTTAVVTRAVDVLGYPIASVTGFSTTQGSLVHEYIMEGTPLSYNGPIAFVGTDPNIDFIFPDQGDATGTSVARNINGVFIQAAGIGVGSANWGPSLTVFRDVLQRGAMSWAINQNVNAAHNAIPHNFTAVGPPASLPVIVKLTLSGPVIYQYPMSQWARRTRYWPRQLSQAELIAATTLDGPTLSLDFMTPGTLDPRIVFTRASTATYTDATGTIQTAAANAPRWDYKAGVLQGLLIEEQRANGIWPSTNWYNIPLSPTNDGWIPNIGMSPSGANDAMGLIPSVVNTVHQFFLGFFGAVNTTYTYSVYVKAAGYKFAGVSLANSAFAVDQTVQFDLSNGTVTSQALNGSGKIQPLGNGWYRCSVTNTSNATGGNYISNVILYDDAANFVFAGDGVKGVWVFGQQVEVSAFPTSYIPTTSAAVTRAADVAVMPTNVSWFNANFGTLQAETSYTGQPIGGFAALISFNNGADVAGTFIEQYIGQGGLDVTTYCKNNSILVAAVSATGTVVPGAVMKTASRYQPTSMAEAFNGVFGGSATITGSLPLLNQLMFMPYGVNFQAQASGYMRRVTYWNRALSDTEMQQVTI